VAGAPASAVIFIETSPLIFWDLSSSYFARFVAPLGCHGFSLKSVSFR